MTTSITLRNFVLFLVAMHCVVSLPFSMAVTKPQETSIPSTSRSSLRASRQSGGNAQHNRRRLPKSNKKSSKTGKDKSKNTDTDDNSGGDGSDGVDNKNGQENRADSCNGTIPAFVGVGEKQKDVPQADFVIPNTANYYLGHHSLDDVRTHACTDDSECSGCCCAGTGSRGLYGYFARTDEVVAAGFTPGAAVKMCTDISNALYAAHSCTKYEVEQPIDTGGGGLN
mmetsp:Transcript_57708/g.172194  ORF Transcript_57708/g.172194 Transcript_57708/m.172194 type:complete len:226 (-) Transcript_57708:84-761(-)